MNLTRTQLAQKVGVVFFGAFLSTACTSPKESGDSHLVIADTLSSSVQIFNERGTGGRRTGSAVVLAESVDSSASLIITVAHTFEPVVEQSVEVFVPAGHGKAVDAKILAIDSERDLALLEATTVSDVKPARLAYDSYLVDPVWVVAFPWGRDRTVVRGAVSQIHNPEEDQALNTIRGPVKLIDATVSYGMSGGGVFDSRNGELLGLVRGYRTAHLSLDSSKEPLKIPVAGETTVIPSTQIACFLHEIDGSDLDRTRYSLPETSASEQCRVR